MQARTNLKALEHLPEAQGLIQAMLRADPRQRPSIRAVMEQPFWWSPARRLAFLIHISDRVELCDREVSLFPFVFLKERNSRGTHGAESGRKQAKRRLATEAKTSYTTALYMSLA